jgi:hypothetical protein
MDDRERKREIAMAYAKTCTLIGDKRLEFQRYVEDIVGRPVSMDKIKIIADEMKKKLMDTFNALCKNNGSPKSEE